VEHFRAYYLAMSWFKKSAVAIAEPETVVDVRLERLQQIDQDLPVRTAARDEARKQVRELRAHLKDPRTTIMPNGLFASIGAMTMATPHVALEKLQRKLDSEVDALLWERSQILMSLGRIR
jgi:hypothetical protein